jgi:hypothetical protein
MLQLQAGLPLIDDGIRVPRAYRTDIVAGEIVIPEIRSIEQIPPVLEARLLNPSAPELLDGVAAELEHQPGERWPPPFRQHRCSASSGNTAPSVFHAGRQRAGTVPM